ncbi:MAG TPA: dephospho-CoA kinase [Caldithrix abyssi]|uniref:Dephospho-CoA kinase n=1 Tax=Caldithrix abyssi TaxID=187145 RepID=A0A7V5PQW0_CALAY|nr:dephospho-CoA kinase [Caldithrix abyssi]
MAKRYKDPLIVAVTGGIGSGQSTVCKFFEEWGCKVINADLKAKEVIHRDKKLQKELMKTFGNDIFDHNGKLNTKLLAERAFRNELEIQKLNQLVHPRMVESLVEEMEQARFSGKYPLVIIDAALIYEISIEKMFDAVVVVDAPMQLRQQRVKDREGMTRKQFKERVDRQIPLEDKVKWADFVIQNDGTLDELKERTRKVFDKLMRMASDKRKVS